jgi:4-hydroxybenzoate polyprenyltransferase
MHVTISRLKNLTFIYLQMVRIRTAVLMALFAVLGSLVASGTASLPLSLALVVLCIINLYVFGTSMNDIADYEIDRINLKHKALERPLVKGNGTRRDLWLVGLTAAVLSLAISLFLGSAAIMLTAFSTVVAWAYSMPPFRLSRNSIAPHVLLPYIYVLFPLLLAFYSAGGVMSQPVMIFVGGLYLGFVGRIILKDFRDVIGDKKFGKRTFVIRYGQLATCLVAILAWTWGSVLILWDNWVYVGFLVSVITLLCLIVASLVALAYESVLRRQLIYVAMVGRLGNGVLLSCILLVADRNNPSMNAQLLLLAVCGVSILMALETYLHLRPSNKKTDAV